jgi:hypothetical protein
VTDADITRERADELLHELGERLAAVGARYELVVVGGSALLARGIIDRTTRDIDVVAFDEGAGLIPADPLPEPLERARDLVARDLVVDPEWLNGRASDIARFGLPEGFMSRVETRRYGSALVVHYASRYDLIHFKLHAFVDRGDVGGKHAEDLRALAPTRDELVAAARWTTTHDPSEGYRWMLERALAYLGVENAALDA